MINTPVRCPMCLAALEVRVHRDDGAEVSFPFSAHTLEICQEATKQRIRVLQETLTELIQREQIEKVCLDELARWIGMMSHITDAGKAWLRQRKLRLEDIERLRGVFRSRDVTPQHPLWESEAALAEVLNKAILLVSASRGELGLPG